MPNSTLDCGWKAIPETRPKPIGPMSLAPPVIGLISISRS
jgi:hypothetical protein